MIRKWFWFIGLLLTALPMSAQVDGETRFNARQHYMGIGVKAGVMMPDYYYWGNDDLNRLSRDTLWANRIRPVAGVQLEIPVGECLFVSPELMYMQRGDSRIFHNIPSDADMVYTVRVNYLDLRVPVAMVLPLGRVFQPYVFAGVDVGMVMPFIKKVPVLNKPLNLSGVISENANSVEVNASNMAPFDAGLFGGVGGRCTMRFDRFSLVAKLEIAYGFGIINTFSAKELNSAVPAANLGAGGTHYSVGSRFNRGLECTFGLVLPLHFQGGDACSFGSGRISQRKTGHYGF